MVHGTMAGSQSMVDSQPWGGVAAPSLGGHHNSSERERERGGGHQALKKGSRWCYDGDMVLGVRKRDWS
jgi:hypothetical protein